VEYDPAAIRPADEVPEEPGLQVVNVRSLAGVLWFSAALGPASTAADPRLERRVASAIGLLPGRGTVGTGHCPADSPRNAPRSRAIRRHGRSIP
jgi:hypothetical protein